MDVISRRNCNMIKGEMDIDVQIFIWRVDGAGFVIAFLGPLMWMKSFFTLQKVMIVFEYPCDFLKDVWFAADQYSKSISI